MNLFANSSTPPVDVRDAFALFEVFVVVMAVFVLFITIMVLRRWIHRRFRGQNQQRPPKRNESKLPDPWKEAAKRIKPYDKS